MPTQYRILVFNFISLSTFNSQLEMKLESLLQSENEHIAFLSQEEQSEAYNVQFEESKAHVHDTLNRERVIMFRQHSLHFQTLMQTLLTNREESDKITQLHTKDHASEPYVVDIIDLRTRLNGIEEELTSKKAELVAFNKQAADEQIQIRICQEEKRELESQVVYFHQQIRRVQEQIIRTEGFVRQKTAMQQDVRTNNSNNSNNYNNNYNSNYNSSMFTSGKKLLEQNPTYHLTHRK